ncbi:hypothetical protein QL285_066231 [Trifolium repens]|nr:hypothetical protein QL285_066231 [Trifolium repens]
MSCLNTIKFKCHANLVYSIANPNCHTYEKNKIWVLLKNQIPDTLTSLLNLSHPQPFIFSSPKSKSLQTRCRWYDRWCSPSLRPHHPFPVGVLFAARMLARSTALICFPAPPCSDFR